ncbi:hypothetical protein [Afifella sp. IM 167]|uniref:hypothetical protein n=1 Tax=Afifella sp. IM 167 TaxID=2033586 RepID=UPI001CC90846|nr:hypothetical protein [Afifella sp. IM 167]MBZ8133248.1 hypothetical protein [Afifella sp. IM 167]
MLLTCSGCDRKIGAAAASEAEMAGIARLFGWRAALSPSKAATGGWPGLCPACAHAEETRRGGRDFLFGMPGRAACAS